MIAGTYLFNGTVESYLGVPYATPPTGALRWRAPQPAPSWTTPLAAASSPPACPQRLGEPPLHSQDEDCLYLNVVAPTRSSTLHPVLVYIHGGSYVQGGVAEDRLNASWAVARRRDLVVVTLQYRLGLLGWLGGSRLAAESNHSGASGNYGLLDQRLALAWVQQSVRAFGGDPTRVLVAGQSAGAGAVSAHLVSRGSRGLFSRAALLSGAFASWVSQSAAGAQAVYGTLAAAAGCASNVSASAELSCLRGLSADALLAALPPEWEDFGPTVGGAELPAPPSHLAAAGALAPGVPIVAGSTEEDGTPHLPAAATASDFDAWVGAEFGASSLNYTTARQALLKTLYDPAAERRRPDGAHSAAYWSQIHLLADAEMACPAIRTARWRGVRRPRRARRPPPRGSTCGRTCAWRRRGGPTASAPTIRPNCPFSSASSRRTTRATPSTATASATSRRTSSPSSARLPTAARPTTSPAARPAGRRTTTRRASVWCCRRRPRAGSRSRRAGGGRSARVGRGGRRGAGEWVGQSI